MDVWIPICLSQFSGEETPLFMCAANTPEQASKSLLAYQKSWNAKRQQSPVMRIARFTSL